MGLTAFTALSAGTIALVDPANVLAGNAKANYALSANPTSQTIQATSSAVATYVITVSPLSGSSNVTLSLGKLPGGATACWNTSAPCPNAQTTSLTVTNAPTSATLSISGASASGKNPYTITVNGVNDVGVKHSIDLSLTVNPPASYSLSVSPSTFTTDAATPASYTVTLTRTDSGVNSIALAVSGLPKNATGTFDPATANFASSTSSTTTSQLTITPDMSKTPSGTFTITITATANGATQRTQATLNITDAKGTPFTIAGDADGLAPGAAPAQIDASFSNPSSKGISVTSFSVSLASSTSVPACAASDFAVTQYSGPLPLAIPAGATRTLSQLGIDPALFPTVQLLDRAYNQDDCKGVHVTLKYAGSATGL